MKPETIFRVATAVWFSAPFVMAALNLTGVADIQWLWVFSPYWIPVAMAAGVLALALCVFLLCAAAYCLVILCAMPIALIGGYFEHRERIEKIRAGAKPKETESA